ncbi:MAG: hypothetical protein IKB12_02220 [Clostridia bacterium]|nr:hypothetical protein [Clostridia bacterium]
MDKESIEIIHNTLKPDRELIERTKIAAMNQRVHKTHVPAFIAALFVLVICISIFIVNSESDGVRSTLPVSETTTEESEIFYSNLISHRQQTTLNVSGYHTADIASFNERFLEDCVAVIEGEILSAREKEYTVLYEYDKFGTNTLTEKTNTIIYEIKVEKVWCGDIKANEIITVQDELFTLDKIFTPAVGGSYVLPLCDSGENIRIDTAGQKYLRGDTKRESRYSTLYPFHPQIERTDRGYLFTSDWVSLVTDETKTVTVDIPLAEDYYADKMRLNSADVFERQFKQLLIDVGLVD